MVAGLNRHGIDAELWFENHPAHREIVRQVDVPGRHLDFDLTLRPWAFLGRLARFRRQLRETGPRVLHAHQMRASLIPLLAARLEGVPVRVYHNHGLPYLGYRGPLRSLLRTLEQINIRLATHVLLVSHSNLAAARADGLLPEGKGAVPGAGSAAGIDLAVFTPDRFDDTARVAARKRFALPAGAFVLAYVGRPVRRKGFHRLLDAWEHTGLGARGHALVIAGCTEPECRRAAGRTVPGVTALGYLPDLKDFYAASDAVVLPSEHEGFPYSLLEGAAAGRALLGTDIPGIRCAIRAGETGLLAPPGDEPALRAALLRLASDPALRALLGRNARARVEREFDRETVLQSLVDFYRTRLL